MFISGYMSKINVPVLNLNNDVLKKVIETNFLCSFIMHVI